MTRKKVKLAFISNDSSRKATFKKRKKGLIKKVNEISTLCGITACAVIYSPYDANPEVWPSNSGVQRVVSEFQALPEMDQNKKMVDQESFLRQRIAKASEYLRKQRKENRELEMTEVMFQCLVGDMGMFHMNIMDLNDLGYLIDQYLKNINRRMEILQSSGIEIGESSNALVIASEGAETMAIVPATTVLAVDPTTELGSSSSSMAAPGFFNPIEQQQQHIYHMRTPHLRIYEQSRNQTPNQNQQQWFGGMINRHEQMIYAAQQKSFSFMADNHHNRSHHQLQQQQIPVESSTVSTTVSSSDITPVTNSNIGNNIWFR